MQIVPKPHTLARRIVASVSLGLGLILVLFGIVVLWTIRDSTEAAYRARVMLAETLTGRVDDVLRHALVTLEREASGFMIQPGQPLTDDQRRRLASLRLQVGTFVTLTVTDVDGTITWSDPGQPDVATGDPLHHPSVQLVLRMSNSQIAECTSRVDEQKVFACLAVPLRDPDGQLAGVLMAELDPRHPTLNLLPTGEVGDGMHAQLLNVVGRVVAGNGSPASARQHQVLLDPLIATHAAGYVIHEASPWDDFGTHLVAYAPLSLLPSWGVVVEQPQDLALMMPHQLTWRLGLLGLAALLLATAVAWWDVRRVVNPLKHLTAAAERFAAGDLGESVQLSGADELGILARAFETMRQRLRASLAEVAEWNHELERRVAVRTAEVERLYENLRARERERAELLQRVMGAQEEERRRLAQELHDETSQALSSLRLGLERLASGLEESSPVRQLAGHLQDVAAQTLAEVHRLAVELRPSVLDDIGLVAAIERYLQQCAQRWGLIVDFAPVGVDHFRLIPAAETAVYRVVQSALTNVVQHAHAHHVSVLFEQRNRMLVVVIEDDGQGFDLPSVHAAPIERRLGLAGMEERASLIGATLTIETTPGAGTTLFLEIPLEQNARMEDADAEATDLVG